MCFLLLLPRAPVSRASGFYIDGLPPARPPAGAREIGCSRRVCVHNWQFTVATDAHLRPRYQCSTVMLLPRAGCSRAADRVTMQYLQRLGRKVRSTDDDDDDGVKFVGGVSGTMSDALN